MTYDIAWLAGFFDGDGFVGIYFRKARPGYASAYFVHCAITQNNLELIESLQRQFGGHIQEQKSIGDTGSCWGHAWVLSWTYRAAEQFLRLIEPHVVLKKPEVQLALRFRDHKRGRGGRAPENYKAEQEAFRQQMKALKQSRKDSA